MQLFETIISGELTVTSFLICLFASLICGIITALSASFKSNPTKSFVVSLVLLPMIVSTVITMVNGNIGTGVAVMGAFSLVRFRSVPGKAKDIAAIFLAMTSGLACSGGYVGIAILFTALVCVVMLVLSFIPVGEENSLELKITVPEALRFNEAFEDLFKEYTKSHRLTKVKTSNMGSLYILNYKIQLKDKAKAQNLIDDIRCRNGNLEISIYEASEGVEAL